MNIPDKDGFTPLLLAAQDGHVNVVNVGGALVAELQMSVPQ